MIRTPGTAPLSHPAADLDRLLGGGSTLGLGDGALLDRVAAAGLMAEAAFEALFQRHGPMVARVCRGILGDSQLAEDAAQAVFLVLLRRARSIGDPTRLAPWLHGVALRTARAARRAHRRHALDPISPDDPTMTSTAPDPTDAALARERAEILHAAIARLPHRYRGPVVLCDLEGHTHAEAAGRLDCPTSTVSIRLKRARERLRSSLARHRLDFESTLPPIALGAAPRALAATAAARLLARHVLGAAALTQIKAITAAALVAGLAAVGTAAPPARQDPPPPTGNRPDTPAAAVVPQAPPAAVVPPVQEDPPRRGLLRIAKLRTTGDWNLAPRAIPNLLAALRATLKTNTQVDYRELDATDPNLIHYPMVYLQDRLPLAFGDADRDALRRLLVEGGGMLLADAAGADLAGDTSFRRFIADLIPAAKLEPILPGDALYSGTMNPLSHDLADVRRTVAAGGAVGYPDLEGVKLNGRWAVIYSKLDIGSALQGEAATSSRGYVPGYTPESAIRIATNVVIYATLPGIPPPPNGVMVGLPTVRDVTDHEQYNGRVAASRTVEVRARVNGFTLEPQVAEGDYVKAGQVLFGINNPDDNRDLERQIKNVQSQVQEEVFRLAKMHTDARGQEDPAENLAREKHLASLQELRQLEAQRASVVAPFAGQVARRLVDVGATVEAGKTPLATIVAVDPILVDFEMDERTFLKIRRGLNKKPGTTRLPVRVQLTGEEGFPHEGRVLVQTGRFDPEKGTCTLHAELPNPDHALIPGLSAQIQVEYGDPHRAFLVPEGAIETERGQKFLRVVDAAGVVQRRPIKVGMLIHDRREVREGIDAETRIILDTRAAIPVGTKVTLPGDAPPR